MKKLFKLRTSLMINSIFVLAFLVLFSSCKKEPSGPSAIVYMDVSPNQIDFGIVPVDESEDMEVIIKNRETSTGNLAVTLGVAGEVFSLLSSSQLNLQPGESTFVKLRFIPVAGIEYVGSLSIGHNATNVSSPKIVALKGTGDATITQIISLVESGWQSFSNRNYDDAFSKFDQAVSLARTSSRYDSLQAEAECGRGWARAYKREFSLAKNDLLNSLAHQSVSQNVSLNAKAGLALVHHALNEFSSAIQRALEVLNLKSDYTFQYDPRVYHKRLRLVLAQSYYTLGDFQKAAQQLDLIDPANAPHSTDPTVLLKQIQEMWGGL